MILEITQNEQCAYALLIFLISTCVLFVAATIITGIKTARKNEDENIFKN